MLLDDLDRRIVMALQLDGRASWTAIAESCDTSVATVARRAQQLIADGVVRVAVMPEVGSSGPVDSYVLRVRCTPGLQVAAAEALARRDDIRFLAMVTGEDDLIAELVAPRDGSLYEVLVHQIQSVEGVGQCRSDLLLHVYKVAHDWSRQLRGGGDHDSSAVEPAHCEPAHFDDVDRAMLKLLSGDGRTGFRALGDRLGINESTARRRFERMQTNGCVSVVTLVPAPALGLESETLMRVSVAPGRLDDVARALAAYRSVRYLAASLDGSVLLCEVIATSTDDLFRFVSTVLARLDGVLGWSASTELLAVKRGFIITPWWEARATPRGEREPLDRLSRRPAAG